MINSPNRLSYFLGGHVQAQAGLVDQLIDVGELIGAVHRFLARTPCQLAMNNLDDLLAEKEQLNLPGTVETYPNWRRRLAAPLESLAGDPFVLKVLRAVAAERGGRM